MAPLPSEKIFMLTSKSGTYAIILEAFEHRRIAIGKLGILRIEPGCYIYIGSAFGPGGIRARLSHHQKISRSPHWHIDYLRPATEVTAIWYSTDRIVREHHWAQALAEHRKVSVPLPGFGASDCDCPTHLLFFRRPPSGPYFRKIVRYRHPNHGTIRICNPLIRKNIFGLPADPGYLG